VVLSGPLGAGKTTLAEGLRRHARAQVVSARQILIEHGARAGDRHDLQRMGAELDRRTSGEWLVSAVSEARKTLPATLLVLDAARSARQVQLLRKAHSRTVVIFLSATPRARLRRYNARLRSGKLDAKSLAEATAHPIEQGAEEVLRVADLVIETTGESRGDVLRRAYSLVQARQK
jgi:adenylosuccinate synthase